MKAFISDIHANAEALCSVMADIDTHAVDEIICLGDIVGYGADPQHCVDVVMERCSKTIMGNHDYALLHGPTGFNPMAADAIRKTQNIMKPSDRELVETTDHGEYAFCSHPTEHRCLIWSHSKGAQWDFIMHLPSILVHHRLLYVHGSPLDATFEYVLPDKFPSRWKPQRIAQLCEKVDWLSFGGHTHHPCAIGSDMTCFYPSDETPSLHLAREKKYLINIGSVGQPRDNDNRACYCLFDEENDTIQWRRCTYDIETAASKIEVMCGEENWCGQRLFYGK
ncbi:MAG: metallophosphoesterase family protein [Chitinivibrionales bacterium]|nr:metallophosphoesterase family protein [Chitinivibrionales bacterium]